MKQVNANELHQVKTLGNVRLLFTLQLLHGAVFEFVHLWKCLFIRFTVCSCVSAALQSAACDIERVFSTIGYVNCNCSTMPCYNNSIANNCICAILNFSQCEKMCHWILHIVCGTIKRMQCHVRLVLFVMEQRFCFCEWHVSTSKSKCPSFVCGGVAKCCSVVAQKALYQCR